MKMVENNKYLTHMCNNSIKLNDKTTRFDKIHVVIPRIPDKKYNTQNSEFFCL